MVRGTPVAFTVAVIDQFGLLGVGQQALALGLAMPAGGVALVVSG